MHFIPDGAVFFTVRFCFIRYFFDLRKRRHLLQGCFRFRFFLDHLIDTAELDVIGTILVRKELLLSLQIFDHTVAHTLIISGKDRTGTVIDPLLQRLLLRFALSALLIFPLCQIIADLDLSGDLFFYRF